MEAAASGEGDLCEVVVRKAAITSLPRGRGSR